MYSLLILYDHRVLLVLFPLEKGKQVGQGTVRAALAPPSGV